MVEPEIQDGMRAFPTTQTMFQGAPVNTLMRSPLDMSWYDESVDTRRGAFMYVAEGADLDDIVGEFVRIRYQNQQANVYCLGASSTLSTPIAVNRRVFLVFSRLTIPSISVYPQVIT
jgi:hypothetical protein